MKLTWQHAWSKRGLWLGPCACVLALLGTLMLADGGSRRWGAALIPLGSIVAVIAWRRAALPSPFGTAPGPDSAEIPRGKYAPAVACIVLASVIAILGGVAYDLDRTATFGLPGLLWVASILLLIVGCLFWPRPPAVEHSSAPSGRWPWWEIALFLLLFGLAAVLRLWDLNNYPFYIFGDETETGRIALDAYVRRPAEIAGQPIFSLLWPTIDMPGLWFILVANSIQFAGGELWGLRLPAALFGSAIALPLYGFLRIGWGRGAAIAGTVMFAFSAVAVHYSRVTLNNIVTPFFWAVCFFFIMRGLRTRRPVDWALAGLAGGLSEYFYYGTRLLPFILIAFFGYLLVTNRHSVRSYAGHFGLTALGYLVGFGPLIVRYVFNPALYTGRAQGWLSWDHIPVDWPDFVKMVETLWPITRDNFLGLTALSSQDVFYFAPLMLPIEGTLLMVGLVLLAVQWRHPASFLALLAAIGVILTGGTLVIYGAAPSLNHWTPAFPALFAALAAPVGAWLASSSGLARNWTVARNVGLAACLVAIGYLNVSFYFKDYYAHPDRLTLEAYRQSAQFLEVRSAQAHFQRDLGLDYLVRFVGDADYLQNPVVPYLAPGQDYGPVHDPAQSLFVARKPGMGLAFVILPGGEQFQDRLRQEYPGGSDGEVFSRAGRHLFYTYILDP